MELWYILENRAELRDLGKVTKLSAWALYCVNKLYLQLNVVILCWCWKVNVLCWFWCLGWLSDLKSTIHWEANLIHYAAEISAEICESYEYLYVMYMIIMQAWIFECKIWDICMMHACWCQEKGRIWDLQEDVPSLHLVVGQGGIV